ncbi:hypothetical protein AXF42_Ash010212 [Apostasia shenzhenica]|uniref:Replication factor A C-terminal domain-containing protein n=1 Tax=Apostasia shenzhenica TaxID=1088818 RepID=A0A2I0A9V3_9ASPA|nr:hypothetical protein AXF42_Ash010212 [Apostasia shenzhenica]
MNETFCYAFCNTNAKATPRLVAEITIKDETSSTATTIFGQHLEQIANITPNIFEATKNTGKKYNVESRIQQLQQTWFYFDVRRQIQHYKDISKITLNTFGIKEVKDVELQMDSRKKKAKQQR